MYRSHSKYDYQTEFYQSDFQPSETVPGQSMSVRELFERWSHGLPLDVGRTPIYPDEEPDLNADIGHEAQGYDLADYSNDIINHSKNVRNEKERIKRVREEDRRRKEFEDKEKIEQSSKTESSKGSSSDSNELLL